MSQQPSSQHLTAIERLKSEIHKQIVGQDKLVERVLVALISSGHVLLEGVPGLAKTRLLTTLTTCIDAEMSRVQFTPDLLPSDLVGTEVFRPQSSDFVIRKGPIFANLLLADEINRAPAKVQSALLQAMQEREVTIGEETFKLPDPFLVLATQNPIEQEGTYRLPEAQLDRFLMKVIVDYPSFEEEVAILKQTSDEVITPQQCERIFPISYLRELRTSSYDVFIDEKIDRYIVAVIQASREPDKHGLSGMVDWGASPRGGIALKSAARSLSFVRGKGFVSPDEIKDIAPEVLRHRILPSIEAEARNITSDAIVDAILKSVAIP